MMSGQIDTEASVVLKVDHRVMPTEAMMKVLYWLSRDFICNVVTSSEVESTVRLTPRDPADWASCEIEDLFKTKCLDFALRERISAQTSEVRDVLLAKAFAESGVLEDQPSGTIGDSIEEAKPDGMFRILSNGI